MKTVLITGAAGSLGSATAKKFLAEGYHVIGVVNHASSDESFESVKADLTDEAATEEMINQLIAKHGNIDVLVSTAGSFAMGDIAATKMSDIKAQFKVNFETAYNVAQPVFTHMMKRGSGRIFLIGSRPGLAASAAKGMVAYSLAKSSLLYLTELMNEEAKGVDVVASLVAPSIIDTPANRKDMPQADVSRWVTPEAIADVIHFYCSDAASVLREPVIKVYGKS